MNLQRGNSFRFSRFPANFSKAYHVKSHTAVIQQIAVAVLLVAAIVAGGVRVVWAGEIETHPLSVPSPLTHPHPVLLLEGEGVEDVTAWTTGDTGLQVAYTALHVMDWSQTLHMARNPSQFEEGNPVVRAFIGRHPSEGRVNLFVGGSLVAHTAIAVALPRPYRTYWQAFWIGVEAGVVGSNVRGGIRLKF